MLRFTAYALPLLILLLAVFGFVVEVLDLEPAGSTTIRLAILEQARLPAVFVLLAWLMEACGLMALFLVTQGRAGFWWLDGLLAGWLAWVFRGPLLVLTVTVAAHQSQEAWWRIVFGWWVLYSCCGLALAALARGLGESEEIGASRPGDPPRYGPPRYEPLGPAAAAAPVVLAQPREDAADDPFEAEPGEPSEASGSVPRPAEAT